MVAGLVVFTTTPIYTARTTLLIERKEPQVVDVKNVLSKRPMPTIWTTTRPSTSC